VVRSFLKRLASKPFRMWSTPEHAPPPSAPAPELLAPLPAPDSEGYVAILRDHELIVGQARQAEVSAVTVAVFRTEEGVFAIDNACLHEDGPLGDGRITGNIVTCPYHDWRYDVRDGSCLSRKGRKLATYHVREREGFVWVGARRTGGTEARGGEHDDGLKQRSSG
jgi:nitrite reductase/ring-hydroxylating ferredoxin subunit